MNITLVEAERNTYSKFFATYRKNIWFRPSWTYVQKMMLNANDCFWIYKDNKLVAGISLVGNTLGSFFTIPPFKLSVDIVLSLKDIAIEKSKDKKRVDAYNVLPEHFSAFKNAGFRVLSARKCMIRPTEIIKIPSINDYISVRPKMEHLTTIVHLMNEAYRNGVEERNLDTYRRDILYYLEHNKQEELLDASSVLIHKKTNEIVGICLVSLWEELPLIYEIAVKPLCKNKGLGRYMLSKAITNLEPAYPVLRLFITSGNKAEYLYSNLGFISGEETSHLVFYAENKQESLNIT